MSIVIGTGWCASAQGHSNSRVSSRLQDPDFLTSVWRPYIERFVRPRAYSIFQSRCDVLLDIDLPDQRISLSPGIDPAADQDHRHDWFCSVMMGAQYALCCGCDFVYIEQDCLVYGLDRALAWAEGRDMVYGYGDPCQIIDGWAEHSFFFVSSGCIPDMLAALNTQRVHETVGYPLPEIWWHNTFARIADFWPFGFGRKRPLDWDGEAFYAQQLTEDELRGFLAK